MIMKITKEVSLENFEAWSGGKDTLNELTSSECLQLESQLEDLYPDGMDETQVNDILWFEQDWIAECLGYKNWEHLERDHAGISDEDHARDVLNKEYPLASDELKAMFDKFIEEEWTDDMDDYDIIDSFKDYREDLESEEEDE